MESVEKLKSQNHILRSIIENYQDFLVFSVDREYRYVIFNSAFRAATLRVYGVEVVEGMSMLDSISNPDDRARAKNNCDRAFAGEDHTTGESFGELERFYFETRYNPIVNDAGEIVGVTVLSSNITERIRAEEQLQQSNKELEAFSYSVSHDLRAPLRSIIGFGTILQEEHAASLDAEAKRMLGIVCRNAQKMGTLIDDLLEFSRMGRRDVVKGVVNMNVVVGSVVDELCGPEPERNGRIVVHDLLPAPGDLTLIRQVWVNLISNALKYSRNNQAARIEVGCVPGKSEALYYIKDNGVGFDMRYADKLFGVFQRLHREDEFEGTGVGLAIVQRIISRHRGRVWADAKPDEGATFSFALPLTGC